MKPEISFNGWLRAGLLTSILLWSYLFPSAPTTIQPILLTFYIILPLIILVRAWEYL